MLESLQESQNSVQQLAKQNWTNIINI
jgi:hypothetical protein